MTQKRRDALEILKKQIREQRARIDPKVLKAAEDAVKKREKAMNNPPGDPPADKDGKVPYDKQAAAKAVALFLRDHADGKGFEKRLMDMIRKSLN